MKIKLLTILYSKEQAGILPEENSMVTFKLIENHSTPVVNAAMLDCDTEFVTVLSENIKKKISNKIVFKLLEYSKDKKNTSYTFIGLVQQGDSFNGTINEYSWAFGAMNKQGYLDLEKVREANLYDYSLIIWETETIKKCLKKESFKYFADYEQVMRYLYQGNELYIIPFIGYVVENETTMSDKAGKYQAAARKVYQFDKDRNLNIEDEKGESE